MTMLLLFIGKILLAEIGNVAVLVGIRLARLAKIYEHDDPTYDRQKAPAPVPSGMSGIVEAAEKKAERGKEENEVHEVRKYSHEAERGGLQRSDITSGCRCRNDLECLHHLRPSYNQAQNISEEEKPPVLRA